MKMTYRYTGRLNDCQKHNEALTELKNAARMYLWLRGDLGDCLAESPRTYDQHEGFGSYVLNTANSYDIAVTHRCEVFYADPRQGWDETNPDFVATLAECCMLGKKEHGDDYSIRVVALGDEDEKKCLAILENAHDEEQDGEFEEFVAKLARD